MWATRGNIYPDLYVIQTLILTLTLTINPTLAYVFHARDVRVCVFVTRGNIHLAMSQVVYSYTTTDCVVTCVYVCVYVCVRVCVRDCECDCECVCV